MNRMQTGLCGMLWLAAVAAAPAAQQAAGTPALLAPPPAVAVVQQQLVTRFGTHFNALVGGPQAARAGVLLLPGRRGLTAVMREWGNALATQGYRVVAIDFYDGRPVRNAAMAREVWRQSDPVWKRADIEGGLDTLQPQRQVAVIAWDRGATLLSEAVAVAPERIAGAVVVAASRPEGVEIPLLSVTGASAPTARVGDFLKEVLP